MFSSLSQWVHACDALELPHQQREQLDAFIDQLYKDIDKGHFSFMRTHTQTHARTHTLMKWFTKNRIKNDVTDLLDHELA